MAPDILGLLGIEPSQLPAELVSRCLKSGALVPAAVAARGMHAWTSGHEDRFFAALVQQLLLSRQHDARGEGVVAERLASVAGPDGFISAPALLSLIADVIAGIVGASQTAAGIALSSDGKHGAASRAGFAGAGRGLLALPTAVGLSAPMLSAGGAGGPLPLPSPATASASVSVADPRRARLAPAPTATASTSAATPVSALASASTPASASASASASATATASAATAADVPADLPLPSVPTLKNLLRTIRSLLVLRPARLGSSRPRFAPRHAASPAVLQLAVQAAAGDMSAYGLPPHPRHSSPVAASVLHLSAQSILLGPHPLDAVVDPALLASLALAGSGGNNAGDSFGAASDGVDALSAGMKANQRAAKQLASLLCQPALRDAVGTATELQSIVWAAGAPSAAADSSITSTNTTAGVDAAEPALVGWKRRRTADDSPRDAGDDEGDGDDDDASAPILKRRREGREGREGVGDSQADSPCPGPGRARATFHVDITTPQQLLQWCHARYGELVASAPVARRQSGASTRADGTAQVSSAGLGEPKSPRTVLPGALAFTIESRDVSGTREGGYKAVYNPLEHSRKAMREMEEKKAAAAASSGSAAVSSASSSNSSSSSSSANIEDKDSAGAAARDAAADTSAASESLRHRVTVVHLACDGHSARIDVETLLAAYVAEGGRAYLPAVTAGEGFQFRDPRVTTDMAVQLAQSPGSEDDPIASKAASSAADTLPARPRLLPLPPPLPTVHLCAASHALPDEALYRAECLLPLHLLLGEPGIPKVSHCAADALAWLAADFALQVVNLWDSFTGLDEMLIAHAAAATATAAMDASATGGGASGGAEMPASSLLPLLDMAESCAACQVPADAGPLPACFAALGGALSSAQVAGVRSHAVTRSRLSLVTRALVRALRLPLEASEAATAAAVASLAAASASSSAGETGRWEQLSRALAWQQGPARTAEELCRWAASNGVTIEMNSGSSPALLALQLGRATLAALCDDSAESSSSSSSFLSSSPHVPSASLALSMARGSLIASVVGHGASAAPAAGHTGGSNLHWRSALPAALRSRAFARAALRSHLSVLRPPPHDPYRGGTLHMPVVGPPWYARCPECRTAAAGAGGGGHYGGVCPVAAGIVSDVPVAEVAASDAVEARAAAMASDTSDAAASATAAGLGVGSRHLDAIIGTQSTDPPATASNAAGACAGAGVGAGAAAGAGAGVHVGLTWHANDHDPDHHHDASHHDDGFQF